MVGWTSPKSGTEFVIGLLPLGGYVKMLDEGEGPVLAAERSKAFNTQTLKVKTAIVLAGPVANLLFAVALYAGVNWMGVEETQAILAKPVAGSVAASAGLGGGERVLRVGFQGEDLQPVASFENFRWWLTRAALAQRNLQLEFVKDQTGGATQHTVLALENIDARNADAQMFRNIGVTGPYSTALLGDLSPGSAAVQSGLEPGDLVLKVDQTPIADAAQLRELIRASGHSGAVQAQVWHIVRAGAPLTLTVLPKLEHDGGLSIGRLGAMIGTAPARVHVRYGLWDGLTMALTRTWEVSALTLKMMGKIVIGEASLKNLSGPITIADYAGKSASMGITSFVVFLALISISLGVLNLLPIPVLDGGHLMYYLWESLTGRPVSELWMERLQKGGMVVLLLMTSVAVFNDITRLLD
jgi:regulator of sigma E protease